jgi:hypothetical protein
MNRLINSYSKQNNHIKLQLILNTFSSNVDHILVILYKFIYFFSTQRPFMKMSKFKVLKKKILDRFTFITNLRKNVFTNFYKYLYFYLYFFNKYYTKKLKYNYNNKNFIYYLDNPNLYFKTQRINKAVQIKIQIAKFITVNSSKRESFKNII